MATNLGLEFNKRVYRNIKNNSNQNLQYRADNMALYKLLIETKLADLHPEQLNLKSKFGVDEYASFNLITSGQGFLIGTGNEHGTGAKVKRNGKNIESHEFKMGFHFDHTTGIPVITGHNLKGRIRSFFPIAYKVKKKKEAILNRLIDDLKDCFKNDENLMNKQWSENDIVNLQNILFEGIKEDDTCINPIKQDTFLGAYPSKSFVNNFSFSIPKPIINNNKTNYNGEEVVNVTAGTFLFDDTLAYHPHPLYDPMPLTFLKILADVEIVFQFKLNNEGLLKKEQKEKLFKYLLNKYGAGAKTSSGYGQFKKETTKTSSSSLLNEYMVVENFNPVSIDNIDSNDKIGMPAVPKITNVKVNTAEFAHPKEAMRDTTIEATIISIGSGNIKVKPHYKDSIEISIQGKINKKAGDVIKIKLTHIEGSEKKGNLVFTKAILV